MSQLPLLFWLLGAAAVIDGVRHSEALWVGADRNKSFWITLMALTGGIGGAIYLAAVRPRLRAARIDAAFVDDAIWQARAETAVRGLISSPTGAGPKT